MDTVSLGSLVFDYTLRPAVNEDIDGLYEILRESLGPYVDQTWGWDEAAQARHFRERFPVMARQVIEVGGKMAGLYTVEEHPDRLYLANILIAAPFRRQGLGTRLILRLIEQGRSKGLPVTLSVLKVNLDARRLYEKLGFDLIGETDTHYQMKRPLDREDSVSAK